MPRMTHLDTPHMPSCQLVRSASTGREDDREHNVPDEGDEVAVRAFEVRVRVRVRVQVIPG